MTNTALIESLDPGRLAAALSPESVDLFVQALCEADRAMLAAAINTSLEGAEKRRTTMFLSQPTELQVEWLKQRGNGNFTELVRVAIDRMFQTEYRLATGG